MPLLYYPSAGGASGTMWNTSGNSGLVDGASNFLGTNDTVPVRHRANNKLYGLFNGNTNQAQWFDFIGQVSIDQQNRNLMDSLSAPAIDWDNRTLKDPTGIMATDWNNRTLNDLGGLVTVDWYNRILNDSSGTMSVDWYNRLLQDNGFNQIMNWNNGLGFFGTSGQFQQPSSGAVSASSSYGTTEQDMLNYVYNAVRAFGLMS